MIGFIRTCGAAAALTLGFLPVGRAQGDPGYDWSVIGTKVTAMEVTYMPDRILFAVEGNAGNCGSGTWLTYAGTQSDNAARQANVKAVYAALIAAKTTSTPIRIYGINSGCKVTFFYLG